MREHEVYITRAKRGLGHPGAWRLVKRAAREALTAEAVAEPCEISVTFTDDAGIRVVNREQRAVDRPTDVLSFPMGEHDYDTDRLFLGDMVLSLERAAAQGEEYGGGFDHELQYLTVHSVLHLLGYDHLDEGEQKAAMRAREKEIMKRLGYDY